MSISGRDIVGGSAQVNRESGVCRALPLCPQHNPDKRPAVLAVDDDEQWLRLLRRVLNSKKYKLETSTAIMDALAHVLNGSPPDLVLLDLHLTSSKTADGLILLQEMRRSGYRGAITILSGDNAFEHALEAARSGANGYLIKTDPMCLRDCLGNGKKETPWNNLTPAAIGYLKTAGLTDWDMNLLDELSKDYDREKEIAARLGRSHWSIRKQLQNIRTKLNAKSQGDLARMLGVLSCFATIDVAECHY